MIQAQSKKKRCGYLDTATTKKMGFEREKMADMEKGQSRAQLRVSGRHLSSDSKMAGSCLRAGAVIFYFFKKKKVSSFKNPGLGRLTKLHKKNQNFSKKKWSERALRIVGFWVFGGKKYFKSLVRLYAKTRCFPPPFFPYSVSLETRIIQLFIIA